MNGTHWVRILSCSDAFVIVHTRLFVIVAAVAVVVMMVLVVVVVMVVVVVVVVGPRSRML